MDPYFLNEPETGKPAGPPPGHNNALIPDNWQPRMYRPLQPRIPVPEQSRNPGFLGLEQQLADHPPQSMQQTNPAVPSTTTKRPEGPASENQPPRKRGRPRKEAVREHITSQGNVPATDTAESIDTQNHSEIQATKAAEVPTEAQIRTPVDAPAARSTLMGPANGPPDTLQLSDVVLSGQEHQGLVALSDEYSKAHRNIRRIKNLDSKMQALKQRTGPVSVGTDEPVPEGSPRELGPGYFNAKLRSYKEGKGETEPEEVESRIKNDIFMGHVGHEAILRMIRRAKETNARQARVPSPVAEAP